MYVRTSISCTASPSNHPVLHVILYISMYWDIGHVLQLYVYVGQSAKTEHSTISELEAGLISNHKLTIPGHYSNWELEGLQIDVGLLLPSCAKRNTRGNNSRLRLTARPFGTFKEKNVYALSEFMNMMGKSLPSFFFLTTTCKFIYFQSLVLL